jgi:acyl-coenzyme A thioesterase PaaI-like protein
VLHDLAAQAGLRLVSREQNRSVVTLPLQRGARTVHPGAVTALAEAAAAAASDCDLDLRGIAVNFVRPRCERPLVAEARVLGSEGVLRTCEVEVSDWNGSLVAKGFVTFAAE